MSTFLKSNIEKGSDMIQDYVCSTCKDRKLEEPADYYCESCVQFFCANCIYMHRQLFTKHSPHGRGDMKKWPVAKKVEDFLLKCDIHKEENLTMFCKDHSQLYCGKCAFLNHRKCKTVMFLSDLVKHTSTDLKQLSVTIQTSLVELKELQDNQEASILSVQSSFDEQLHKIQDTREQIIAALNMLEKKTRREMKDTLTKMQATLKSDVDNFATLRCELKQLGDAIRDICDKSKQELSLIASIKCQDKIQLIEKYRKKNFVPVNVSITFQPNNEIVKYMSKLSSLGRIEHNTQTLPVLGNSDQVIQLGGKSEHYVRLIDNSDICSIKDICVLPNGQVLVADNTNGEVKLLNQQYQVVSRCRLSGQPFGICQITPSEVGVTIGSEVQFIKVNNSQLVTDEKLQLNHDCIGISNHLEDLFVSSFTALYKYSLSGKLVNKLHEDKSDISTEWSCAVSPTGDKLYISKPSQNKLLTLARDGSVLAIFTDPELQRPTIVHVTPAGQVLVCGEGSHNIIQVDSKGSRKLATLATRRDGVKYPYSVCYNSNTDSIIVGMWRKDQIHVYKVQ